jgi:hypothetical protein
MIKGCEEYPNGVMEIRFSTDGAIISEQEEYQWLTYQ